MIRLRHGFALPLALLSVIAPVPAAAAPATTPLRLVTKRTTLPLVSDGRRYVAFGDVRGSAFRVVDAARRTSFRIAKEPACRWQLGQGVGRTAAFGQLLLWCDRPPDRDDQHWRVENRRVNLRTRETFELAPSPAPHFHIGRYWLDGDGGLVNWRTGERRSRGSIPGAVHDLDDPQLHQVCGPVRSAFLTNTSRFYEAPWIVHGNTRRGLSLIHCSGRRTVLEGPERGQRNAIISSGLVTWTGIDQRMDSGFDGFIHAYDIATGRRYAWRVPDARDDRFEEPFYAVHTRRRVFIAVTRSEACDKTCSATAWRVYSAPVPR